MDVSRANQIRAFRAEVEALRAEGVNPLTGDSEARVAAYHDALLARPAARSGVARAEAVAGLSRGMQIASFFGALTLSAAIYSLVARFWGGLDLPLQIGLLTLFPVLALAGVDLAARREPSLYVASLFASTAYATFWLAAVVAARLLDVPLTPIVIWMGVVFGLALAIAYGFRVVLAGALLAMIAALSASLFSIAGAPWTMAASRVEPAMFSAFSLLLLTPGLEAASAGLGAVTRRVSLIVGFVLLLFLSMNAGVSLWPLPGRWIEGVYQGLMLLACVAAIVVGLRWRLSDVANIAAAALAVFLVSRYADWFWELLPRYLFFLILAAAAFAWLIVLRRVRGRLEVRA